MKIVMKETADGSVDGISTATYKAGEEYDLTATAGARDLAEAFVGAGLAEEVGAIKVAVDQGAVADEAEVSAADATETPSAPKPGRKPKAQ
jgi:hypothetical protein